jgi:hypothetical protein
LHFSCHGSHLALTVEDIVDEVEERVALSPVEVRMRYFPLVVAQIKQEGGDGIGYGGTLSSENAVTTDADAEC